MIIEPKTVDFGRFSPFTQYTFSPQGGFGFFSFLGGKNNLNFRFFISVLYKKNKRSASQYPPTEVNGGAGTTPKARDLEHKSTPQTFPHQPLNPSPSLRRQSLRPPTYPPIRFLYLPQNEDLKKKFKISLPKQ